MSRTGEAAGRELYNMRSILKWIDTCTDTYHSITIGH
jgi:hypothetical protein